MPSVEDHHHDFRCKVAKRNLKRLAKVKAPVLPEKLPEALSEELPDAYSGAVSGDQQDALLTSMVEPTPQSRPYAHPETHLHALLATVPSLQPKRGRQTWRARFVAWLGMILANWLGALGALLGAPPILDFGLGLSLLTKWTMDNKKNISAAQKKQVCGKKENIDWQCSFFAFMECTGVYLRDVRAHTLAWNRFQSANYVPAKENDAIKEYLSAYDHIEQLAKSWNMEFWPIDLLGQSAHGSLALWDGPFCGIFYTTEKQADNPFIGIAFKGTNPVNINQWLVNFNYQLVEAKAHFNGKADARVSEGVYTSLFGRSGTRDSPYDMILEAVRELMHTIPNHTDRPVPIHVTGHSLGGSYANMCYTQLLIDIKTPSQPGPRDLIMGDEYTFGAPRIGGKHWAQLKSNLVASQKGQAWRIVNNIDLVPMVPPTSLQPVDETFHHVDQGVRIRPHKRPYYIPSELERSDARPYPIYSILFLIPTILRTLDHREYLDRGCMDRWQLANLIFFGFL